MKRLQVICFYWEGDRWRKELDLESVVDPHYQVNLRRAGEVSIELASQYVNNLYKGVKRHASQEFDFICFTNEPLELDKSIEKRPFPLHTRCGVLPRVYMFSPEAGLGNEQVLCLDIDVIVVGDMTKLMEYRGLFCARSKYKPGEEYKLDGDIMSFRAGDEISELLWEPFIKDIEAAEKFTQGRERYWVRECVGHLAERWENVAPGAVLSYKRHIRPLRHIPKPTAIVSCHGTPRPHQVPLDWVKVYWNG